jgi:hypothetical protein
LTIYLFFLAQISFLAPSQLSNLSPENSLLVAAALGNSGKQLSSLMAKSLGANIPGNTSASSVVSISSAIPISCFSNSSPSRRRRMASLKSISSSTSLVSLLPKMDVNNMDTNRKTFIALTV